MADTTDEAADSKRSYGNVTAIDRVLSVLETINRLTFITVKRISAACDLPPSTVVRILETLCDRGYLVKLSRREGYALTYKIRALSSGYRGAPLIVEAASRYVDELTETHLWPFSLATLDNDAMVVQYSSIPISPLAHARTTLHRRLSLIGRAHGIAYLAFCSSVERSHLVRLTMNPGYPETEAIRSASDWRRLILSTRRRGWAIRPRHVDPTTCSIAAPVLIEKGFVVATIGMTFFTRSLREARVNQFGELLCQTAQSIGQQLRASGEVFPRRIEPAPSMPI